MFLIDNSLYYESQLVGVDSRNNCALFPCPKSVSFGLKKDNIEKRDSDANISDVLTSLKIAASVDEREVEIKKIDDAMRGVSFLKTQVDVKTGTLRIVELSDTHTPDGRSAGTRACVPVSCSQYSRRARYSWYNRQQKPSCNANG